MKTFKNFLFEQQEMFQPPSYMVNAAKKALKYKEKYPKDVKDTGTPVGWGRASDLASERKVSLDIVKRIYSFLSRHKGNQSVNPKYKNEPWKDNGYLSHLLWGSDGSDKALNWAKSIIDRNEK